MRLGDGRQAAFQRELRRGRKVIQAIEPILPGLIEDRTAFQPMLGHDIIAERQIEPRKALTRAPIEIQKLPAQETAAPGVTDEGIDADVDPIVAAGQPRHADIEKRPAIKRQDFMRQAATDDL